MSKIWTILKRPIVKKQYGRIVRAKIDTLSKQNNVRQLKTAASLDTLAQPYSNDDFALESRVEFTDKKTLVKKARRKFFTSKLSLRLVDASKQNVNSKLQKSYWNSYYCNAQLLYRNDGKITGKYCKCRWCMTCNAIRTAQSINTYVPVIKSWSDAHMVTLTIPNCKASDLRTTIYNMYESFRLVKMHFHNLRNRKSIDYKFIGVRKIECTYNPVRNDYHPHFHIIVKTKEMAQILHDQWLVRQSSANVKGQDIRKADIDSLQELFKYMTKVISKRKDQSVIYADSLDVIFNAMKGRRVLQNFGFKLPNIEENEDVKTTSEMIQAVYEWQSSVNDWVDLQSGECLTGYSPSEKFKDLIENKIWVRDIIQ